MDAPDCHGGSRYDLCNRMFKQRSKQYKYSGRKFHGAKYSGSSSDTLILGAYYGAGVCIFDRLLILHFLKQLCKERFKMFKVNGLGNMRIHTCLVCAFNIL